MNYNNRPIPKITIENIDLSNPPPYSETDPNTDRNNNNTQESQSQLPPRIPQRPHRSISRQSRTPHRSNSFASIHSSPATPISRNNSLYSRKPPLPPRSPSLRSYNSNNDQFLEQENPPTLPKRPSSRGSYKMQDVLNSNNYNQFCSAQQEFQSGPKLPKRPPCLIKRKMVESEEITDTVNIETVDNVDSYKSEPIETETLEIISDDSAAQSPEAVSQEQPIDEKAECEPEPAPVAELQPGTETLDETEKIIEMMETFEIEQDIFQQTLPIGPPPAIFPHTVHPVSPPIITPSGLPIETNKFYGNLLLASQTLPTWTHPYSVWVAKDPSQFGLAVSYVPSSQKVFAPGVPPEFYFSPVGIKSLVFGATEFSTAADMTLVLKNPKHMSVQLQIQKSSTSYFVAPLVQGMGFVTAVYSNMTPVVTSGVGFVSLTKLTSVKPFQQKYSVLLQNQVIWTLYLTVESGQTVNLTLTDPNTIKANAKLSKAIIQIVRSTENSIDTAAGCYSTDCELSGYTTGTIGKYIFKYSTNGSSLSGASLHYALPHHVQTFAPTMGPFRINSKLDSTTKGVMTGYIINKFEMTVTIPTALGFAPFTTIPGKAFPNYTTAELAAIRTAAQADVLGDVVTESNVNSMYFAGKILAKYAWVLYVCQYILKDSTLVATLMPKLKAAFNTFTSNTQILPLTYDTTWKGIVSSGDSSQDFGNSYYNDHHFHYGYHVLAAAILGKVDNDAGSKNWIPQNRAWVESLIRDYANPNDNDQYFPVFRSFDWYHGHSWAKGLFVSGDGKDEESSSEDVNSVYALKLWGLVTGDEYMVSRANLQLGIMRVSLNNYFLYADSNQTVPPIFKPNRVSGILFENKVDHTTYFGTLIQYIQMIHAIPITPSSSFIRTPDFVREEYNQLLAPIVNTVVDGWRGVIMLNVALYDPASSYAFFTSPGFLPAYLDPGQSLTWSLAYSAAFN
ncbi:hypothetical protein Kpol_397p14 [Vanderwaltozyma polyspora DSM 70294]|uniref:glucan endo-1,3-beta-D-glucosidase n=1 Tax=Vanderwaltozyma polyspora (strain ATCC 22028 / DSM 70294 / BCRC 21397 / CBS 2163 / NBRC 10782 / NRRL Y-8283 / UCD 57-17) TaxID=436907 RepID=A7TRG5_VANPO|nr:uncharacterized protein Kpol_397p14 [Vanderwaltozyma polyspora DSM 70294]EDO15154.1 hypothetical protein Kpol_397p14 [Vanderwaltozyma polyspora DSM 70294]